MEKHLLKPVLNRMTYGDIINFKMHDKDEYKEFISIEDTRAWGKSNYESWASKYREIMKINKCAIEGNIFTSLIEDYCGHAYREINKYLRNRYKTNEKKVEEVEKVEEEAKKYMSKELSFILAMVLSTAPRISENIVTYRLVNDYFIQELISENKKGLPVIERDFLSTSLLTDIIGVKEAYHEYDNLLKIYVDKGTIGLYVNEIFEIPERRRKEEEILFYPNGYLYLMKYPYKDSVLNKKVYECYLYYY
ncbi:hypothetical protein PIU50_003376 [Clostridioides difficile]|nr:hypothetical protein [Clostridioides difficile]MBZ0658254.1 hypothetical protein [Clostridioides difficile]